MVNTLGKGTHSPIDIAIESINIFVMSEYIGFNYDSNFDTIYNLKATINALGVLSLHTGED